MQSCPFFEMCTSTGQCGTGLDDAVRVELYVCDVKNGFIIHTKLPWSRPYVQYYICGWQDNRLEEAGNQQLPTVRCANEQGLRVLVIEMFGLEWHRPSVIEMMLG